jgi:hypothetical protein
VSLQTEAFVQQSTVDEFEQGFGPERISTWFPMMKPREKVKRKSPRVLLTNQPVMSPGPASRRMTTRSATLSRDTIEAAVPPHAVETVVVVVDDELVVDTVV